MQESMKMEVADGWNQKAGIGLDLGQLLNINPYVGSGSNRLGLGGAVNYKFQYKNQNSLGLMTCCLVYLPNASDREPLLQVQMINCPLKKHWIY